MKDFSAANWVGLLAIFVIIFWAVGRASAKGKDFGMGECAALLFTLFKLAAVVLIVTLFVAGVLGDDRWYLRSTKDEKEPLYKDLPVAYQWSGGEVRCELIVYELRQENTYGYYCARVSLTHHWFNVIMYNAFVRDSSSPLWLKLL